MATILIVDDSEHARAEVKSAIANADAFDRVLEAEDGMLGLKYMLSEPIDVVVCDLEMPGFEAEKLLRARASNPGGSNLPFIIVTASENIDRRTRLLESGASDVVSKPFHPGDLVARLQLHLKIKRLQDELMVKNETLARLSTSDLVTGLRTRRYVSDALSIEYLRARRYDSPLSVLMADLDHFKSVNDEFGHLAGDAVLAGVSSLLLERLRATDIGGRFGGEEILVVLHQSEIEGASILAERWRESIAAARFKAPDGREIQTSVSIGVAQLSPDMKSPEDLISAADVALYQAKDAGRDQVCRFAGATGEATK